MGQATVWFKTMFSRVKIRAVAHIPQLDMDEECKPAEVYCLLIFIYNDTIILFDTVEL